MKETGDRTAFLSAYAERLGAREGQLDAVAARLAGEVGCLMCFERDAEVCHRSLVAARMLARGLVGRIEHL